VSEIVEKITAEIAAKGVISFARFMELALYCPDYGFYEKEKDNVGKSGDFFTSVSVGSLFGELLAFQFAEWTEADNEGKNAAVRIAEAGAHDGRLAADILRWMRERRREVFERLQYYIVEPSARRREWQRETLKDFGETVKWISEISALEKTSPPTETILFSNELFDAMPVHRLGWDARAKKWFEWGVTLEGGRFAWARMGDARNHVSRFAFHVPEIEKLFEVLPDGFTTEVSPAAEAWWREAAAVLKCGKLVAMDYGLNAEEFFVPERRDGTVRAYRSHQLRDDVLANPGAQDITAHVNFTALQNAGEAAGLKTEALVSQGKFLTQIAERSWKRANVFGEWNANRLRQFQTLTHPEHLGRPFRVLIQSPHGD
jgi:SAM-dependent MidA family methyltransferase